MANLGILINNELVDNAEIVIVIGEEQSIMPGYLLPELEAILRFVQSQFPNGWHFVNNEVQEFKLDSLEKA